jgi:SAM-dependent methyltransferase
MLFSNETALEPVVIKLKNRENLLTGLQDLRTQKTFIEDALTQAGSLCSEWYLPGFCEVCGRNSVFNIDWLYSDQKTPNYRERLICQTCGLNNRQRFVMSRLMQEVEKHRPQAPHIYLYEQVTPFFQAVRQHLGTSRITGSEYLGFDKKSGEIIKGIRHEDAMALSFANASIDLVVSNDVLEHVPDFEKALQESARVLTAHGKLIFSIPFYCQEIQTRPRARLENGVLTHLLPEQYHGNPVSKKGSLVFHNFGWDILDHCLAAGFKDAYVLFYHDVKHGYLGDGGQLIFMAEK